MARVRMRTRKAAPRRTVAANELGVVFSVGTCLLRCGG